MVPVVLITFILFLAYYAYRRKQIDKVNTQKESDFWQRENDANSTRKQDITNLDYIQILLVLLFCCLLSIQLKKSHQTLQNFQYSFYF